MKLALNVVRGLAKVVIAICDLIGNIHGAWPDEPSKPEPEEPEEPECNKA